MALFIGEKGTFVFQIIVAGVVFVLFSSESPGQQVPLVDPTQPVAPSAEKNKQPAPESRRILGIIPNYRTSPSLQNYEPLTSGEKFKIASQDAFDRGTIGLAVMYGGENQLTNSNRAFGQGGSGFGRYLGAAYGDFVIGDYMTEAVFPIMLHQDPRYFRRGTGS